MQDFCLSQPPDARANLYHSRQDLGLAKNTIVEEEIMTQ